MIEVTLHAKDRFVERVLNKKSNEKELKAYVSKHNTEITLKVVELFERAKFLWQGKLYEHHEDANFYIVDDIILVTDTGKGRIFTLYKVEIPFPQQLTKSIIDKGVSAIESFRNKKKKYTNTWSSWFEKRRKERDDIQNEIVSLQQNYTKKLQTLQSKQSAVENKLYEREKVISEYNSQIEEYARILCNSLQLRQELDRGVIK